MQLCCSKGITQKSNWNPRPPDKSAYLKISHYWKFSFGEVHPINAEKSFYSFAHSTL